MPAFPTLPAARTGGFLTGAARKGPFDSSSSGVLDYHSVMSDDVGNDPGLRPDQYRPVALDLSLAQQRLSITWADGARSDYSLGFLRQQCPCAVCRSQREKNDPKGLLPILPAAMAGGVRGVGGEVVGNYALRLEYSDGHNTGIYDFRLLRRLHENPRPSG